MPQVLQPPSNCCNSCSSPMVVNIPGSPGVPGAPCVPCNDGLDAFTLLTSQFTVPASGASAVANVDDSRWLSLLQLVAIQNAGIYNGTSVGYFRVTAKPTATSVTLLNDTEFNDINNVGVVCAVGSEVSAAGERGIPGLPGTSVTFPTSAKGDIMVDDGANAPASDIKRLSVAADGTLLQSLSTQPLGLIWRGLDLSGTNNVLLNALQIANGGTGATTKQGAMDALSPCSVTGDMMVYSGGHVTKLAMGAALNQIRVNAGGTALEYFTPSAISSISRYGILGKLLAADFNSTVDQAIPITAANYIIRRIFVTNVSLSLTTAAGGVYLVSSKTNAIVASTQVYNALTANSLFLDLTLTGSALTSSQTAANIYLSLTTPQGAAAVGDIYIEGDQLG